jgi:hypothetical protein
MGKGARTQVAQRPGTRPAAGEYGLWGWSIARAGHAATARVSSSGFIHDETRAAWGSLLAHGPRESRGGEGRLLRAWFAVEAWAAGLRCRRVWEGRRGRVGDWVVVAGKSETSPLLTTNHPSAKRPFHNTLDSRQALQPTRLHVQKAAHFPIERVKFLSR